MTEEQRPAVLRTIRELIGKRYVLPDRIPAAVAALEVGERTGHYGTPDPHVFAERVGADLRRATGDNHFGLRHTSPSAPDRDSPAGPTPEERAILRINHGLVEQRVLDGNVRYLRITDFDWIPGRTAQAYDAAVRFLSEADAVIIDLRGNRGGEPEAVHHLISHFVEPDTLLMTFRDGGTATESRAPTDLPAGRLPPLPLAVLIDDGTYSAGEAFAYHVRHFALGDLIGTTTAGAAHITDPFPVGDGFVLALPHSRPVHPVTGTSWERTGVPPTIPTNNPLPLAHATLLDRLATSTHDDDLRADYRWALTAADAALHPAPPTNPALAGSYPPAEIVLRDGDLWLVRPARRDFRLRPLTPEGLHAADGNETLRVHLTPTHLTLHVRGDPKPTHFPRRPT